MMSDPRYLSLIHDEVVLPSYYLKDNLRSWLPRFGKFYHILSLEVVVRKRVSIKTKIAHSRNGLTYSNFSIFVKS